jgi:hypothetical protein
MDGGQKENIPVLKEYVYDLIKVTTQKDAGQRGKAENIQPANIEIRLLDIVEGRFENQDGNT